jgi:signal transduction histidine kinase
MFFINRLKYLTASIYTLLTLLGIFFSGNAILFHNNLQYGIFLLMVFTILIIESKTGRIVMLASQIILFIIYLLLQNRPSLIPPFPIYKTIIGSCAFLATFACMLEYFKERLVQYHRRLAVANEQLRESNRVKERMISILSHDFYGPVGNLITSINLLDEQLFTPEEFQAASGKLKIQLQVLSTSMHDVLQWSKMQIQGEQNERSIIDISSMIDEISLLMETPLREKNLVIENALEEGTVAYANKDDVKLIFRNLISNAIKFSNNSSNIFINAEKKPGALKINIKDEGMGMTVDMLSALQGEQSTFFSTPGTAKEKGTGLGLMLVREFIQKNDGELTIASEVGKGSTFSVSLPVTENK